MQAAIYSGLLSSNTVTLPTLPFICPSGNCTWDPFSTISVNAACSDISSEVTLNCSKSVNDNNTTTCNFASHNDTLLADMLNNTSSGFFLVMESYLPRDSLSALLAYNNITAGLATVQWVRVTDFLIAQASNAITPDTSYEAGRCLFYMSVDQIQTQVTNGGYNEKKVQTCVYSSTSKTPPYTLNGTNFAFRDPWDESDDLIFQPSFAPDRNFSVTWEDFYGLASSIINTLSDSVFVGAAVPVPVVTSLLNAYNNFTEASRPWAPMLMEADNVTKAMENMAMYMTIALRSNDTELLQVSTHNSSVLAPDQIVQGVVWVPTQFVIVRWGFIALPVITFVLAVLFLSSVIARTRQLHVGIWKSSPLTLLLQMQPGCSQKI